MTTPFDLLLKGGRVVDGTGLPARRADVAVRGERIVLVGRAPEAVPARCEMDVSHAMVCPGFVDAHSHSDAYLLVEPDAPSKIRQGVTTEVIGQCGGSAAPLRGAARHPTDWDAVLQPLGLSHRQGHDDCWTSVAAYREALACTGHAPNVVFLVGHNTLRAGVMGYGARHATAGELALMVRRLEEALDQGAAGFSSGLIYIPGAYAAPEELLALGQTAARRNALYASHIRGEGDHVLDALDEVLALATATGIKTQISHLKTSGRANWHKLDAALQKIQRARKAGFPVTSDRYPYLSSCTALDSRLPAWALSGDNAAALARIKDPATAARIRSELIGALPETLDEVVVAGTEHPDLKRFRGRTLRDVAQELSCDTIEAMFTLLRRDGMRTEAFFPGMSADNLRRIYAQPWVMVGSDASIRATSGPLSHDSPHPRAYGTFPKFLRMVLDRQLDMTIEEGVRRMTSLPSEAFGLKERGILRAGAWADLTVFDPLRIRDRADYASPHQYPDGIECVIVNGRIAFENGIHKERPGRWL